MENDAGLKFAMQEASLRAKHTGADHEIVDDNGEVFYVISDVMHEQFDGMAKVAVKPWKINPTLFWMSAGFIAAVLFRWMPH